MQTIFCDDSTCEYYSHGECCKDVLNIIDNNCNDYLSFTENAADYQEVYYTANTHNNPATGKLETFRFKRKGKRVDYRGYTFFTSDDIRSGITEDAYFTEARTGMLAPLKEMMGSEEKFNQFCEKEKEFRLY